MNKRRGTAAKDGFKTCRTCFQSKTLTNYVKDAHQRDGLFGRCKACTRLYLVNSVYGLSAEQYESMSSLFNGMCHACKVRPGNHVDHDHKTKQVRGKLCSSCNVALGVVNDSIQALEGLISYLKSPSISPCGNCKVLIQPKRRWSKAA